VSTPGLGENVPLPELLQAALPVLLPPFSDTFGLLLQTMTSAPAFATGAGVTETTMLSLTARHCPFPVVVTVSVTVPAVRSVLPGVYVAFGSEADGEKLPSPELVQLTPPATLNVALSATGLLFTQTLWSGPALIVGALVIVTVIWSPTDEQTPLFVEVKVSVTDPAAVSEPLGEYVAFGSPVFGANTPLPLLVHIPLPLLEEAPSCTAALFAQAV